MYQRRHPAHVSPVSAGPIHRYHRRTRSVKRDWAILASGLLLVAGAALLLRQGSRPGHSDTALAAAARSPRPATSSSPAPGVAHPLRSDAPPSLPPPFTWDYRPIALHPAVGVPAPRARSAIVVDLATRRVLYDLRPHRSLPMASTTKLMTAMVALDNSTPDTVLTVPDAAAQVQPDVMGLSAGEAVPVQDLLYGLLLDSGNDAAETLAAGTLGRDAFLAAMNRRAARLGLADTHFSNPTGLDEPGQLSSAHDLAIMAATIYERYPLLEQVVTTRNRSIPGDSGHKAFGPVNYDKMLWTYPGAIGFKTGLTDDAGTCLVTGAHRGGRTLIVVLLNDDLIFTDATKLLDWGFAQPGG